MQNNLSKNLFKANQIKLHLTFAAQTKSLVIKSIGIGELAILK
jgi:hypothetical protein